MFYTTTLFNQPLYNWNVSQVTTMDYMFGFTDFNQDLSQWDVSNVTTMEFMFDDSSLSTTNLTSIYENWSLLTLQENVIFGAEGIKYNSSGQTGKDIMLNTYNWIITDGGL
jgi:surface protein